MPEGDPDRVVVFDWMDRLRVYSRHGTLLSLDNVELILTPNTAEGTLTIYVWRKKTPHSPRTVMGKSRTGEKTEEGGTP